MDRYEEALERAKAGMPMDEVFPELKESEDERIRKALIEGVRQIRCKKGVTQEQMIAYLEKQKEQKPAEWSDSVAKEMFIKALERAVEQTKKGYELTDCDKHSWWEDFKAYSEIKPAEWSEEYIADVFEKVGLAKFVREQGNDELTNAVQSAMIVLSKGHKQEWSEKDEAVLDALIRRLEGEDIYISPHLVVECLKSLKERVLHQKQEWSEEDEDALNMAEIALKDMYDSDHPDTTYAGYKMPFDKASERMAEIRKSLRPQPHWKPSNLELGALRTAISVLTEERNFQRAGKHLQDILDHFEGKETRHDWKPSEGQMSMLLAVVNDPQNAGAESCHLAIQSLYNDLKKL